MSVYVWGKSDSGRLGLGKQTLDVLDPTLVEGFRGNIVDVSSGDKHCLSINELGDVYAWGRGKDGQHGNGNKQLVAVVPQKVTSLDSERIQRVMCGPYHCLAINKEGEVFEWGMLHRFSVQIEEDFGTMIKMPGMNQKEEWEEKRKRMVEQSHRQFLDAGQVIEDKESIGNASEIMNFSNFVTFLQTSPLLVEFPHKNIKIVDIAAGYAFNIAVSSEGQIFSWGINEKKQLGLGHRYNQEKPQLVKSLVGVNIVQVACGNQHVLVLSDDGIVFSWGMGVFGQLGHGNVQDQGTPKPITLLKDHKIIQVACGSNHSLALTDDGKVFTWGSSEYGQQAGKNQYQDWQEGDQHSHGRRKNYYTEPREIVGAFDEKKVIKITCGSLHNVALTDTGEVYTWGWGITGVLGHGDRRYKLFPRIVRRLRGQRISNISASAYMTMAVTASASTTFALDFSNLVNNSSFSDIKFIIGGKTIDSHKGIIFSRCPALRKAIIMPAKIEDQTFINENPESEMTKETPLSSASESDEDSKPKEVIPFIESCNGDTVVMGNIEYYVFIAFLKYLYTDQLKAPLHHIPKIETLGRVFQIPRLVLLCKSLLMLDDTSNAPDLPPSTYSSDMVNAINNSETHDITFNLSDSSEVFAHKSILASRSDYFRTIFEGNFRESGQNHIEIKDIDRNIFLELLRYMYTNDITMIDEAVDILIASGQFLLDDLKQKIEKQLESQLDLENVLDLLFLSESTNTPKLRKACISLLVDNLLKLKNHQGLKDLRLNNLSTMRHVEYLYRKKYDSSFNANDILV